MSQTKAQSDIPLMYFADGGIHRLNLWSPFTSDQLIKYIDNFADFGVDILSQMVFIGGSTKPGLFVPEHPDFNWWSDERFRPLIEAGHQPLEVMIERAHKRHMKFFCKMRMSDWHQRSVEESGFVGRHPEFHNPSMPTRPTLDYTHQQVRDYHLALVDELLRRFDIDGITYNFIRGWICFPHETAEKSHSLMTDFIRQTRRLIDQWSRKKSKNIKLGVIVLNTLELCRTFGYDLPTWIANNLIDYVSPGNSQYSNPNMDHEEWAALCSNSRCLYFPMLQAHISVDDKVTLLPPEQIRAITKTMLFGGADGISVFNWQYYWARRVGVARYAGPESGYPLGLTYLLMVKQKDVLQNQPRVYFYRPIGLEFRNHERSITDSYRIEFTRKPHSRGQYLFRFPEQLCAEDKILLVVRILGLSPVQKDETNSLSSNTSADKVIRAADAWADRLVLDINGIPIPSELLCRVFHSDGRWETFGRPLKPFTSIWFEPDPSYLKSGLNSLGVELCEIDAGGSKKVTIEELEIVLIPVTLAMKKG